MPRFYFDIDEGDETSRDEVGLDLPTLDRAKAEAIATLPSMAREVSASGRPWRLRSRVRNEGGKLLFEATLQMRLRDVG